MQVVFLTMLINTLHAALENTKEAFDGVGRDFPTCIFFHGVINLIVAFKNQAQVFVINGILGHRHLDAKKLGLRFPACASMPQPAELERE